MKVEVGELLILSWLRHVKGCRIVQLNWKPSARWSLDDDTKLAEFVDQAQAHFREEYALEVFNQGRSSQLIRQGEIDVLGLQTKPDGAMHLYAVDIANHTAGLNLGPSEKTIARVLKKTIRSAASIHGYFPGVDAQIIFTSPRVADDRAHRLNQGFNAIQQLLDDRSIPIRVELICNYKFTEILNEVMDCADVVADTSELFLRSVQLWKTAQASLPPAFRTRSVASRIRPEAARHADRPPIGQYVQAQVAQ